MTKTLTEQWREGEWIVCNVGKCKYYYTDVKCYNGSHKEVIKEESVFLTDYDPDYEILGEVPSYEEYKQLVSKTDKLEKKLEIATKALKDYANSDEWELVDSKNVYWSRKRFPYPWRIAGKALKEMEGVK